MFNIYNLLTFPMRMSISPQTQREVDILLFVSCTVYQKLISFIIVVQIKHTSMDTIWKFLFWIFEKYAWDLKFFLKLSRYP
jgi:hypothetical protein